jgi:hypothetical protein
MEQRFAELHEQILREERHVNITVDKMATDMSLMQDLVQASNNFDIPHELSIRHGAICWRRSSRRTKLV